jgi:hypothetical protein
MVRKKSVKRATQKKAPKSTARIKNPRKSPVRKKSGRKKKAVSRNTEASKRGAIAGVVEFDIPANQPQTPSIQSEFISRPDRRKQAPAARVAAPTSRIVELCEELVEIHRHRKRPFVNEFLPGLTEAQIDKQTAGFPFVLPQSVRDIFEWKNGVPWKSGLDRDLAQGMILKPLADTMEDYNMRRESHGDEFYAANWFPLLNDDYCDAFVIVCSKRKSADCPVLAFFNEYPNTKITFRSVEQMLITFLAMFQEDVFTLGDGSIDTDFAKFRRVGMRLNPDAAAFWNDPNLPYGRAGLEPTSPADSG